MDQYQRAIQNYDKAMAIQLDPDGGRAYFGRGYAHRHLGQYTKAEADHAKACSLDSQWC